MSVSLPKGFKYMPVTAWCSIAIMCIPLLISILDLKPYFMFAWDPFITKWNQYWRLIILQLQFQNQSEVAIASVLFILKLKALERLFGSLKMIKIVLLFYLYNLLMLIIISFSFYQFLGWDLFLPSGPFGILFGLYYPYNRFVPETYVSEFDFSDLASFNPLSEVVSLKITDKFTTHILYICLFFNEGITSTVPSLIGYFTGYLYFNDLVPFKDTSMGFLDSIYYKFTNNLREQYTVTRDNIENPGNNFNDIPDSQSHTVDLADEEINNREDTPTPTFGERLLERFRR